MMKWLLQTVMWLLWLPAISAEEMTLVQAGFALGAGDKLLVMQAEATLLQHGWDALGTLDAVIFSGDAEVANRAKDCRRRILYGLPLNLPANLFSAITGFHHLDEKERARVLEGIRNSAAITPDAMACLHSRLIERGMDQAALEQIDQIFGQMIESHPKWKGLAELDPRLLLVPSRALVFNHLPLHKATEADLSTYADWVKQDPTITYVLNERGVLWECDRLTKAKALIPALEWLPRIASEHAKHEVAARLRSWCHNQINDWAVMEPTAMQGALMVLMENDPTKAGEVYRTYLKTDATLSEKLHPSLRKLEINRLLDEGRTVDACGLAMKGNGPSAIDLMRYLGNRAWLEPGLFTAGLPDASQMEFNMAEGFLEGFLQTPRRKDDAWWKAVAIFNDWLNRKENPGAWLDVLEKSSECRDLQIAVYASRGRFLDALNDGRKASRIDFLYGLARLMRKRPDLCSQIESTEGNLNFLRDLIGRMWEEEHSGAYDLREVMRITAGWREALPALIPKDSSNHGLVPYLAIDLWDNGQRIECLNLLANAKLHSIGARVAAGLLHETDDDKLVQLISKASLPEGTLGLWLFGPGIMDVSDFETRCRLVEQLDEAGLLKNQRMISRDADENQIAYLIWRNGQPSQMRQWLQSCYWLLPEDDEGQLLLLAGLMCAKFDSQALDSMSQSPRSVRRPLHRAILLHAMGKTGEAAPLLGSLQPDHFVANLLAAAGRYMEAGRMRLHLQTKSEANLGTIAEIFGIDQHGDSDAARAKLGHLATQSATLSLLLGPGIEHHVVANFDQVHHSFRLIEDRALESIALPALESRMVLAAAGETNFRNQGFLAYLRIVQEMQDRARAYDILSRWLELTPADIEARAGRQAPEQLFRCLTACGWENPAAKFLNKIVDSEGGWGRLTGKKASAICGWELGDNWRESAIWRLVQLEHRGISDVAAMIRVRQLKPLEPSSLHAEEITALVLKHREQIDIRSVRGILSILSEGFISPDLKAEDVELMLTNYLDAVARYEERGPRSLTREQDFWMSPEDMEKNPLSENVIIQGLKQAHVDWNEGRRDEAKRRMNDLMIRALLDRDLPRSLYIYIISTFPGGTHPAGNLYDPVELLVRAAAVLEMPAELVGPVVEILCRTKMGREEMMIESAETLGMPGLALAMQRQRMLLYLYDAYLSPSAQDVPLLRRLECRAAMASGNRDEVLAACKRFIPADPYHEPFIKLMRQWFKDRADAAGMDAVDQTVRHFWSDRLLLVPGFGRYQRQLDRWNKLVAQEQ